MKTDIPQAVLDATQPIEEIPALQVTWHFVGGGSHTTIAPESVFETDGNTVNVKYNGVQIMVFLNQVTHIEERNTVIRKRKEPKS